MNVGEHNLAPTSYGAMNLVIECSRHMGGPRETSLEVAIKAQIRANSHFMSENCGY